MGDHTSSSPSLCLPRFVITHRAQYSFLPHAPSDRVCAAMCSPDWPITSSRSTQIENQHGPKACCNQTCRNEVKRKLLQPCPDQRAVIDGFIKTPFTFICSSRVKSMEGQWRGGSLAWRRRWSYWWSNLNSRGLMSQTGDSNVE